MSLSKLIAAVGAVDWKANVNALMADTKSAAQIAAANLLIAMWSRQFETLDKGNPALCFVREMQVAGQYGAVLMALALYKPAAGSMRAMLETALYYSYFRTHGAELETLARRKGYYPEKREILDFHKEHTLNFSELQQKLGVLSRMDDWYGRVSSLVHGQIPGAWVEHKSVTEIKPIKATQDVAVETFIEGVDIVRRFFLCTTGHQLWDGFSGEAKKLLLSNLHGDEKKALKLDMA